MLLIVTVIFVMINGALNMPRARISKVDLLFCVLKSWEWLLSFGQLSNETTLSNAGSQALMVLANLWPNSKMNVLKCRGLSCFYQKRDASAILSVLH